MYVTETAMFSVFFFFFNGNLGNILFKILSYESLNNMEKNIKIIYLICTKKYFTTYITK